MYSEFLNNWYNYNHRKSVLFNDNIYSFQGVFSKVYTKLNNHLIKLNIYYKLFDTNPLVFLTQFYIEDKFFKNLIFFFFIQK